MQPIIESRDDLMDRIPVKIEKELGIDLFHELYNYTNDINSPMYKASHTIFTNNDYARF